MTFKNGQQRSPKIRTGCKRREPEGQPRSMGAFPATGARHGTFEIRAGREDSTESNTAVTGEQPSIEVDGKLIRQLVDEYEKQLAYHEQQAKYHDQQADLLKERLQTLKEITLNDTE